MGKTLVIAEKPSVARDIARVLGLKQRMDGAIGGDDYIVSWALGHLVTLMEPDELDESYKKWRMESLPILPAEMKTKVIPKTRSQFAILKKLMALPEVDKLICATDSGREGELIFRYIYAQAKCKKPFVRLWISSMTDAAIKDGLAKMKPGSEYDALFESARCRSEADWIVGMNASRAFTIRYDALLPVGRVQTPTLNLIVMRDLEIEQFVPVSYHEVRADFGDYEGLYYDPEKKETRCYDPELALKIKKDCVGQQGTVISSKRELKKTPPPQLFDLTTLQREVNKQIGLSAAKTLQIAQALYEQHKLVTYPRTDSRYLPKDMIPQVKKVIRALPAPYQALAEPVYEVATPMGRVINDKQVTDHHAIIPTGQFSAMAKLNPDEKRVFDMIVRRFLAVHYPDYEYESVQVKTDVSGHQFLTSGTTPMVLGWRSLYQQEKEQASSGELIPKLTEGDTRTCEQISLKKMQTKPPAPHTDASLLQQMENAGKLTEDEALQAAMKDSGLGTPATRAAIIERLIQVKYVERKAKHLIATKKGRQLIQVAPDEICSAETTGRWERALSAMAKEQQRDELSRRTDKFMQSIRRYASFLVDAAKGAPADVAFEREARKGKKGAPTVKALGVPCPVCKQGEVTMTAKAFGCSRWREGCKYTVWVNALERAGGPNLTMTMMKKLLKGETIEVEKGKILIKDGRVIWVRALDG